MHVLVIEQPLTIAFLMLLLPYHYFYAIFNSLQQAEKQSDRRFSYIKLILSLCLLLLAIVLILPLAHWYYYKLQIIYYYPMYMLLAIMAYLLTHLKSRTSNRWSFGRLTCSVLLLLLAVLLSLHSISPIQWQQWLYIIPIVGLLECLGLMFYRYWKERQIRIQLDWWGAIVVLICSLTTYFVLQYSDYPSKILQSFHAPSPKQEQLDLEMGYQYELAPIKLPIEGSERIELRHLNGYVKIRQAEVDELTIYSTLFVNTEDEEQALEIKQQSYIDVNFDAGIRLQSHLPLYNQHAYPRMNIEIVIPQSMEINEGMLVKLDHGALHLKDVKVKEALSVETSSASVNIYSLDGDLDIKTKQGYLFLKDIDGGVRIESRKGSVTIVNPLRDIQATALNGSISVNSKEVGGNWDLSATVGNITAKLPKQAHYMLSAKVSFGKISGKAIQEEAIKQYEMTNKAGIYSISLYASNYIYLQ